MDNFDVRPVLCYFGSDTGFTAFAFAVYPTLERWSSGKHIYPRQLHRRPDPLERHGGGWNLVDRISFQLH